MPYKTYDQEYYSEIQLIRHTSNNDLIEIYYKSHCTGKMIYTFLIRRQMNGNIRVFRHMIANYIAYFENAITAYHV